MSELVILFTALVFFFLGRYSAGKGETDRETFEEIKKVVKRKYNREPKPEFGGVDPLTPEEFEIANDPVRRGEEEEMDKLFDKLIK